MAAPLIRESDLPQELRAEAVDACTTGLEKHAEDLDKAAAAIKEALDRRLGSPWQVLVGKQFSYSVTHEVKHMLYLFQGDVGVLAWKA